MGTYVRTIASVPGEGHSVARVGGSDQRSGLRILATVDVLVGRALDWVRRADLADRARLSRRTGGVAFVGCAANDDLGYEAVRGGEREEGGKESHGKESELHCEKTCGVPVMDGIACAFVWVGRIRRARKTKKDLLTPRKSATEAKALLERRVKVGRRVGGR